MFFPQSSRTLPPWIKLKLPKLQSAPLQKGSNVRSILFWYTLAGFQTWGRKAKRGSLGHGMRQTEIQIQRPIRQKRKLRPFYKRKIKRTEQLPWSHHNSYRPNWLQPSALTGNDDNGTVFRPHSPACMSVTLMTSLGLVIAGLDVTSHFSFWKTRMFHITHIMPVHLTNSFRKSSFWGTAFSLHRFFQFSASPQHSWHWAHLWEKS